MMLSPWKVNGSWMVAWIVFAFGTGTSALAESPFPGETIPSSCFDAKATGDERIYLETEDVSLRSDPVPLPPEGEQYTRLITGAHRAWEITEGSRDVVVAVVDSGMDLDHPDLAGNLWVNEKERDGVSGVDDDGNGFIDDVHGWDFVLDQPISLDRRGHGTHCAGNVGALRNGEGVVGVSPRVKLMPVRFLDYSSGKRVNAIRALVYAAYNGAHVISNSWSSSKKSRCMEQAIEYARKKGALVVASANNNGRDIDARPSYPASYPGVIAVGSSNERDVRSGSSNWGKKSVFIFAPGEKSLSTDIDGYSIKTGTSMAAPQIAGALALGISLRPELPRTQILDALCGSSAEALRDQSRCGRLDLGRFIETLSKE